MGNSRYIILRYRLFCALLILAPFSLWAQKGSVAGKIESADRAPVPYAHIRPENGKQGVVSHEDGSYELFLDAGKHILHVSAVGFKPFRQEVSIEAGERRILNIRLGYDTTEMSGIRIVSLKNRQDRGRMRDVENTAIYAGKKNEVVLLENLQGNTAANSARQIFAKVPGMHIQENDAGGVQMAVSARGLNPSRMLEFNVRQNGYDIAADALGYPESYYTPPAFVLQKIEIVRGAASLQYGPQFGGLINFVLRKGGSKPVQGEVQASVGSFGFVALNAAIGGSKGRVNYFVYGGKRRGDGWRENTAFDIGNVFAHVDVNVSKNVNIGLEYTGMQYTMRQPGGLTDAQYAENPRRSLRNRNWFSASWNVLAQTLDWKIGKKSRLNLRNFMVLANRYSVGNLDAPNLPDTGGYRNLQKDDYLNFGSEIRFRQDYHIRKTEHTLLTGVRIYQGNTHRMQGLGSSGSDANFSFLHPGQPEDSDFRFPSWNLAWFAENVFYITRRFSVTPGIRVEFIQTRSKGYYTEPGSIIDERRDRSRAFALAGLGLAYQATENTQVYGNFSQNYSAVNFNDIRVNNPSLRVDENLHDVKGFNADLGYRGSVKNYLLFDVSAYFLYYKGRIGNINRYDEHFQIYQFRSNLSDSRNIGAELYAELDVLAAARCERKAGNLSFFVSAAYTDARYFRSENKSLEGKRVELAPAYIVRGGIAYRFRGFGMQLQYAHTAKQFTDANNTLTSANGITGVIPAYGVADLSASYEYRRLKVSAGCSNLLNAKYFTRRANGYPGPGILPSDPQNFYLTLGVKL